MSLGFNEIAFRRITYLSCLDYIYNWCGILSQNEKTRKRDVPTGQMEPSDRIAGTLDCTGPPEELFLRLSLTWHFDYSSALCPPHHHNHHHQTNMALSLLPQCGKLRSDKPDVGNVFKCIKIKVLEGSRNEFCMCGYSTFLICGLVSADFFYSL